MKDDLIFLSNRPMGQEERDYFVTLLGTFGYTNKKVRYYDCKSKAVTIIPGGSKIFSEDQLVTIREYLNKPPG